MLSGVVSFGALQKMSVPSSPVAVAVLLAALPLHRRGAVLVPAHPVQPTNQHTGCVLHLHHHDRFRAADADGALRGMCPRPVAHHR